LMPVPIGCFRSTVAQRDGFPNVMSSILVQIEGIESIGFKI